MLIGKLKTKTRNQKSKMYLVNPLAEAYAAQFTSPEDVLLREVNKQTMENHPMAHMLSGHVQGKFLSFLSTILHPAYVLEIGTFTGYSAICLAEGLKSDGELHTIELREEDAATARGNFSKSKRNNQIHLHLGNAKEIIPGLQYLWDLVFIDADKVAYMDYCELIVPRLRTKGIMIADKLLIQGAGLEEVRKGKKPKTKPAEETNPKKEVAHTKKELHKKE